MKYLLKRWLPEGQKLSPLEQRVADYIFDHADQVIRYKVDQLAKELFVSTATISRTCQALGFRGFQELKYALQQAMKENQALVAEGDARLKTHTERILKDINLTIQFLDYTKIRQAAAQIEKSKRVEFFGVGNSLFPCLEAAKKLTFTGKLCNARTDWDDLEMAANSMTKEDLAVLVSYSGETGSILRFANILKQRGVYMISITGHHANRLQQLADLPLQAHITNCYFENLDLCTRSPMSLILDLIVIEYVNQYVCKDELK